ncbi:MAG: BNR-4 repeat-containing protein [Candidatus Krumholzibacteriia bacterium]|nr:BNR-4 repeat-containing protein [bacterium]MCB9516224.1 BNR-4 repeat-containing protein [Candidatus Latescibacterota bacterium]
MRRLIRFPLAALTLSLACAAGPRAPFTVPPDGQPAALVPDAALPAPTAIAFDSHNRPYVMNARDPERYGIVSTLEDGRWVDRPCLDALRAKSPGFARPGKRVPHAMGELVLDDDDALYVTLDGVLLYSTDRGEHFRAYPLPSRASSLELRVGPGPFAGPPAIAVVTEPRGTPGVRWGKLSTLAVILPEKTGDGLRLGEPVHITDRCLVAGSGGHSGGTSFAVTRDGLTHLVWAEMPDSVDGQLAVAGNPTYVGTVDRRTRRLVTRRHLVNAEPKVPDVHSRPTIAQDSAGYLHVIAGAHGQPFTYLRSLAPNDIEGGWTAALPMAERQTYASLVCDAGDRLHSVFRQWLPEATLGYQSKAAAAETWSPSRTLVFGALERGKSDYGIFYQRLAVDRRGNLYLAFTFWETHTENAGVYPEALAVSTDRGKSWRLAATAGMAEMIARPWPQR